MESYCHHGNPRRRFYCAECDAEREAAELAGKIEAARELLATHGNRHERRAAQSKARRGVAP